MLWRVFNINNLFVIASDGTKHLKTGIKADIVDGMHRFAALTSLKQEGGHDWVNQPIRLIYVKKKEGGRFVENGDFAPVLC